MPPRISHPPGRPVVRLAVCCAAAAALMLPALAPSTPAATGHVTLRQKPGSHAPRTLLVRLQAAVGPAEARVLVAGAGGRLGPAIGATRFVKVTSRPGGLARLARRLRGDRRVAAVALDDVRAAAAQPNDPLWAPGLPFDDQDYQRNIRLPAAWDLSRGAPDETIAVVDTGVRADNPDLVGRVAPGLDVLHPGQPPDDTSGHGTMVAGIAAAATDNGILIAGVAWSATILPVKVMNGFGVGRDSDIAAGITWAADHGARVILLALAGPDDNPVLHAAVDYALGKDALVVAAAGASAAPDGLPGASRPMYPAAYPGVIAVSATTPIGLFAPPSDFGPWIGVAAPGEVVTATCLTQPCSGTGTSYAAAVVAGVAVLVRARHPNWSRVQVAGAIESGAQDRGAPGVDPYYGHGWIDAYGALGGPREDPEDAGALDASWSDPFQFGARAPTVGGAPDAFEPNDTPARAAPIGAGVSATFSPEGDVDWYAIDVPSPGSIRVLVSRPVPGAPFAPAQWPSDVPMLDALIPAFEIYDPQLRPIAERTGEGGYGPLTLEAPAPAAGRYYLRLHNTLGARAPYTVDVGLSPNPALTFAPVERLNVGLMSAAELAADVTGDGRTDLVVVSETSPAQNQGVFLLAQRPNGTLAGPVQLASDGHPGVLPSLAAGDLDGDGLTDLFVATDAGVDVYGQHGGQLTGPALIPGSTDCGAVAVTDVDADSRADVLCGTSGLRIFRSTTSGFVSQVIDFTSGAGGEIAVGDLSGDGRPDVVHMYGPALAEYLQRADGGFDRTVDDYFAQGVSVSGPVIADVTGDGRPDVVAGGTANGGAGAVAVFSPDAQGALGPPSAVYDTVGRGTPFPVQAADLNGDGRLDVVAGHGSLISVFLQDSAGRMAPQRIEPTLGLENRDQGLAVGDLDGDGRLDIAEPGVQGPGILRLHHLPADADRPWIADAAPPDRATGVREDAAPAVTFVRDADPTSVTGGGVRLVDGETGAAVPASVSYDAASRTATLRTDRPLAPFTPYAVVVAGVSDLAANLMPGTATVRFRTRPVPELAASPVAAVAGERFEGPVARFTDRTPLAAGQYAASVSWGDGTSSAGAVTALDAGFGVGAGHVYAKAGAFPVTVRVTDPGGRSAQAGTTATVSASPAGAPTPTAPVPTTPLTPTPPAAPTLSRLRVLPARIRVRARAPGCRAAERTVRCRPRAPRVSVRLALSARRRLVIEIRRTGSRRAVVVLRLTGRRGANAFTLPAARIAALAPGRYAITVRLVNVRGRGSEGHASLTVLRP